MKRVTHFFDRAFRGCAGVFTSASLLTLCVANGLIAPRAAIGQTTGNNVSVLTYGADASGSQDSTAAIQQAATSAAAAHATLYFPGGTYRVSSPIELSSSVQLDPSAVVKATAAMPAVFRVGSNGSVNDSLFSGGKIDANNQAQEGIFFRQFQHLKVNDVLVVNAVTNGFHFGDATLPGSSYEAIGNGLHTKRESGTLTPGSAGLFIDSNATDNNIAQSVFVGSDIGVKVMTGGNFFTDIHVWAAPSSGRMTVGFDDYGNGNFWKGCESDTVQTYGMHVRRYNTQVVGCRFYNNSLTGDDNVATGIYFDQSTPGASVQGSLFFGSDAAHRLAADIAGAISTVSTSGNQSINVATVANLNSSVNGQMIVNGTVTSNSYVYGQSFGALAALATSGQNTTTNLSLGAGWYNSANSTSSSYSWNLGPSQASSGTPTTADLFLYTKGTLPTGVNPRLILGAGAATTADPQVDSTQQVYQASYLNSSKAVAYDSWGVQNTLGTGTAPNSTLTLSHWGSSGTAAVSVPNLILHGDTMSAAPRMTWTPYGECPSTTVNCRESSLWSPSKGITITQWSFSLNTAPAGCSTYPIISLMRGTTALVSVKLSSGVSTYASSAMSAAVNSGAGAIAVVVTTAGSGCTTSAAGFSSTVEYMMQ
jgi:hypothetical protein